jgi:CheY-like chemotaxis protein
MSRAMSEERHFDPTALRVLVVGDNAFERRLVMDLLIALGVKEIITADDAVAAFAQLTLKRPSMVIADAEMRPFSGFMLVREIRTANIQLKNVPIVLFTNEDSPDFAAAAREMGANEVLSKPVSASAMLLCLKDAASRPAPVIERRSYRGPERRLDQNKAYAGPRRRLEDAAPKGGVKLDTQTRAHVLGGVDEARAAVGRWADTGETAQIDIARAAVERASETAWSAGADEALTRALAASIRLIEAAKQGAVDTHVLELSLKAARAVLSAPTARNAMRQALAEAVTEIAHMRDAS